MEAGGGARGCDATRAGSAHRRPVFPKSIFDSNTAMATTREIDKVLQEIGVRLTQLKDSL
jgi:hypothetical protein